MKALAAFLERYNRGRVPNRWLGPRPDGRDGQLPRLIAARLGYPTTTEPFDWSSLVSLTREQAAHVLAVAATPSLAYGPWTPKEARRKEAAEALRDLGDGAVFFGNGLWQAGPHGWTPLTSSTFDCGVIGYDAEHAFIFWVEEED